jgi:chemotaxis family two-component system response regulator Rcp1
MEPVNQLKGKNRFMEHMKSSNPINVLLVEDNPADIRLTREAFKDGKIQNSLSIVMDGEEALLFLRKKNKYASAPDIDIVLLDLNLPKKDGREVLAEIKQDAELKLIPVIILTTSSAEQDILNTYSNHANCYIMKPVDFNQFMNVVRTIEQFWLTIVKLPTQTI